MYVISLVFFGFAVRKYKDKYIPAAVAMMLWFLLTAMLARPAALLLPYLGVLGVAEKIIFAVMTMLLLGLCVLRKKPLRIDWLPMIGTVLAAVIRLGWYGYFHWFTANLSEEVVDAFLRLETLAAWKDFALQIVLCAVAVFCPWRPVTLRRRAHCICPLRLGTITL